MAIHPEAPSPTIYSGNARLEQELGRHNLAAAYKFSLGRHLLRQRNLNQLVPGALQAPVLAVVRSPKAKNRQWEILSRLLPRRTPWRARPVRA